MSKDKITEAEQQPEEQESPSSPRGFRKGHKKVGGRQKGTPNKYSNVRDYLKRIIMPYLEPDPDNTVPGQPTLAVDLMRIDDPKDRVAAVASVLPYVVPKFTSTTITADTNRPMSEEQHLKEMDVLYTERQVSININTLTVVDNDPEDPDNKE